MWQSERAKPRRWFHRGAIQRRNDQPRPASIARPPSPPPPSLLGPPLSVAAPASAAPELDPLEVACELVLAEPAAEPLLPLAADDEELPCRSWRSGLPLPISVLCPQATIAVPEIIMKETASTRHRVREAVRTRFHSPIAPASESTLR
jgi:hypothetical protein